MASGLKAVSTIASMELPCFFAEPGLATPDPQKQMLKILLKCGNEDITISRCSNIEYIEIAKNPYFDKIFAIKANEWEADFSVNSKCSEPKAMSHEEKEKYLAQAKINVPI
jgi:hypothetical protein